jgi:hypothetical protein
MEKMAFPGLCWSGFVGFDGSFEGFGGKIGQACQKRI